jgi:hypothetical protein
MKLSRIYNKASEYNRSGNSYLVQYKPMGYPTKTIGDAWTNSLGETVINIYGMASAVPFNKLEVIRQ